MGLFGSLKDAQSRAQQAAAGAGGMPTMPGMGGMDMSAVAAEAQKMQRIAAAGVQAPGIIHSIAPSGQTDMSGGQRVDFEVSIRPPDGEPFQTTINQSMLPAQLETISEGQVFTAKYDPDAPAMAILYSW